MIEGADTCFKAVDDGIDPAELTTIDKCSNRCNELSAMFAYGTNDFGGYGCKDGLCKCHCINIDDGNDCKQEDFKDFYLFKFNNYGMVVPNLEEKIIYVKFTICLWKYLHIRLIFNSNISFICSGLQLGKLGALV